jgi:hypothetical protein
MSGGLEADCISDGQVGAGPHCETFKQSPRSTEVPRTALRPLEAAPVKKSQGHRNDATSRVSPFAGEHSATFWSGRIRAPN